MNARSLSVRLATLALVGLLPMSAAGCGFFMVHGPPDGHETLTEFSCTRGNALPAVDAVLGGTALLAGLPLLAAGRGDEEGWTVPFQVVGAGLALEGVVFGASAAAGFKKTSRCREALRRLEGRTPAGAAPPRSSEATTRSPAPTGIVGAGLGSFSPELRVRSPR